MKAAIKQMRKEWAARDLIEPPEPRKHPYDFGGPI
jgi:hypothetical protein